MSSLFGKILGTVGEVVLDVARISAHSQEDLFAKPRRKKGKTCTPCEAVRRVEAASQRVEQFKRGR